MNKIDEIYYKELDRLTHLGLTVGQAKCHMVNFEDNYICHKYNGGCYKYQSCRKISEKRNLEKNER